MTCRSKWPKTAGLFTPICVLVCVCVCVCLCVLASVFICMDHTHTHTHTHTVETQVWGRFIVSQCLHSVAHTMNQPGSWRFLKWSKSFLNHGPISCMWWRSRAHRCLTELTELLGGVAGGWSEAGWAWRGLFPGRWRGGGQTPPVTVKQFTAKTINVCCGRKPIAN